MKQSETVKRDYYSVEQTAKELGVSAQSVYQLCKTKDFPAVRISPRRIVIPATELAEWMRENAGSRRKV